MRTLLLIVLLSLSAPALAQSWSHFENPRFGFVIDVPPGYTDSGTLHNEDGQVFTSPDGTAELTVLGGSVLPGSFNTEWERRQAAYAGAGWTLTYKPVAPNWTSFTGARSERRLYVKMLPLCGGTKQFAMFSLEYPAADEADLGPVIERLASSLTRKATGFSC